MCLSLFLSWRLGPGHKAWAQGGLPEGTPELWLVHLCTLESGSGARVCPVNDMDLGA